MTSNFELFILLSLSPAPLEVVIGGKVEEFFLASIVVPVEVVPVVFKLYLLLLGSKESS